MEDADFFQYEYTMPDSPASDRLVINMDGADGSGKTCAVNGGNTQARSNTLSAFGQLPSFNTFGPNSPLPHTSWWYKLPSEDNTGSNLAETPQVTNADNLNQVSTNVQDVAGEKPELADRSFLMESILGPEQDCYNPRHSTPTKSDYRTAVHQTTVSENSQLNSMLGTKIIPATEHYFSERKPNTSFVLQSSHDFKLSENIGPVVPFAKKSYRRHSDKPPYSYVAMVIVAISTSDKKELTLAEIREKLMGMFPFFRGEYTGWKNSVRHALSKNKCFYKVEHCDEQNTSNASLWKVNVEFVKPKMFNRTVTRPGIEEYKLTLQEELCLPPYVSEDRGDLQCKSGIRLPPKPCYKSEPGSLTGSNDDDFLNARNDIIPTPQSSVSDLDFAQSDNVQDVKLSRKRKRTEEMHSVQTTSQPKQMFTPLPVATDLSYYGQYMQSSDSVRPYDPFFNCYQNNLTNGQQLSHDFPGYGYGYPQQTTPYAQPWNLWGSNDEQSLRQWWFRESMYYGMGSGSVQPTYYPSNSGWFPSVSGIADGPLNLTKTSGHEN